MRGAPHKGLAWLMRRIRSRMFAATSGLPGRGGAISWSNARRKRGGANGERCRAELSRDIVANRTSIGTTQPTRSGRSGGGASDAARSFGKLQVGDEVRGSRSVGQHGFEEWRLSSEKGDKKRTHRGSHHDLTNDRNPCVFRSDGVFGSHTFALCGKMPFLQLFWCSRKL